MLAAVVLGIGLAGALVARLPDAGAAGTAQLSGRVFAGATAPVSAQLAYAVQGNVTVLLPDGSTRRLTCNGNAEWPALSPDGRMVAYLVGTRDAVTGAIGGRTTVWIAPAAPRPSEVPHALGQEHPSQIQSALAWSPDGRRLAYFEEGRLIVRSLARGSRPIVLRAPGGTQFYSQFGYAATWSPDSLYLAVALFQPDQAMPLQLDVAIFTAAGGRVTRITASRPPDSFGIRNGNVPVSLVDNDVTWSPDGRNLLFGTILTGEGWQQLTGIWEVGASGGMAHLLIGTLAAVRDGRLPSGSSLNGATHWAYSPDHKMLATDPQNGLWVASAAGTHGRVLPVVLRPSCAIATYAWLHDGTGLAYLRICTVPGSTGGETQSTLFVARLGAVPPRSLVQLVGTDQSAIDIGPAYRCVGCGG
jgi:Tol biopolymer transport system component